MCVCVCAPPWMGLCPWEFCSVTSVSLLAGVGLGVTDTFSRVLTESLWVWPGAALSALSFSLDFPLDDPRTLTGRSPALAEQKGGKNLTAQKSCAVTDVQSSATFSMCCLRAGTRDGDGLKTLAESQHALQLLFRLFSFSHFSSWGEQWGTVICAPQNFRGGRSGALRFDYFGAC